MVEQRRIRQGRIVVLSALVGMTHWLAGNLYEELVIAPNWVVGTGEQLERLHGLFVRTSPTTYFVPVTFIAPLLVWAAHAVLRQAAVVGVLRRASAFALLATLVNAWVVITIVRQLFGNGPSPLSESALHALCVRWNVLNGVRIALTAATVFWLFTGFRWLELACNAPACRKGESQ
jgi:hypothetical protein